MATLASQLVLSFVDRVTAPVRGISRTINGLQQRATANAQAMAGMHAELVGAAAAGIALYKGIAAPVTAAADLEASMNRVEAALSPTSDEFERLTALAKDMGRTTQFTINESALAIEMLAKNGLDASQILGGALKTSMDVAAASGADLSAAADIVTDVMYNFKIEAEDLARVADGISGVLLASKFNIDDYRLALAQAGGVAGGLGISLEDFNTSIAATSSYFASGSDAGTSFKTFIQRLVPGSKAATSAMQRLGLEFFNADGSMKSMAEISEELKEGLEGLSDEAKNEALQTIFGTDAIRTALALAEVGSKAFEDLQATIANTSAAEQAAARMKGFWGTMKRIESALNLLSVTVGESLLPVLTATADKLIPIIDRAIALAEAHPKLTAAIIGTAAALVGLRIAAIATSFAFLWMKGGLLAGMIGGLKLLRLGTLVLAPALGALALAGLWVFNNWKSLVAGFRAFQATFVRAVRPIAKLLDPVIAMFGQLFGWVENLTKPIENGEAAFARFGRTLGSTVGRGMVSAVQTAQRFGEAIGGAATSATNLAQKVASFVMTFRVEDIPAIVAFVDQAVRNGASIAMSFLEQNLPGFLQWVWEGYRNGVRMATRFVIDHLPGALQWIWDTYRNGVQLATRIGLAMVPVVLGWLQDAALYGAQLAVKIAEVAVPAIIEWLREVIGSVANFTLDITWPKPPEWLEWLMNEGAKLLGMGGEPAKAMSPEGQSALDYVTGLPTYSTGGQINGPGTGTSDSILARVSNGEYVVNANAAARYGALLDQINSGGGLPSAPNLPAIGGGSSASTAAPNINIDVGGVHVQSNADPNTIARAVGEVVSRQARSAFSNGAMNL